MRKMRFEIIVGILSIGLGLIGVGLFFHINLIVFLSQYFFSSLGLLIVFKEILQINNEKQNITYEISATCTENKIRSNRNDVTYCPVYKILFHNKEITLCDEKYTTIRKKEVGQKYQIKINPEDPNQFTDDRTMIINGIIIGLGIVIIVSGIIGGLLLNGK